MSNDIAKEIEKLADDFGIDKKRSIGDVAQELNVEPHVIRFWEEQFPQIQPEIGKGGRRYYYNKQLKVLKRIKKFLHDEGYTIAGLQKLLKKRKPDSYKEEDLDIIASGDVRALAERDISDFIAAVNGEGEYGDYHRDSNRNHSAFANDDSQHNQPANHNSPTSAETPSANFVANTSHVSNINKGPEAHLTKEQRDEISSLFKNITRNLGDLKMLLRS